MNIAAKTHAQRIQPEQITDRFTASVEDALKHFADPVWLEEHSPLAAPSLLGTAETASTSIEHTLGHILQQRLKQAANDLSKSEQALLTITYFERDTGLNDLGISQRLNLSRRTFYRHRQDALPRLADAFLRLCRPALRSESPSKVSLVGRSHLTTVVQAELAAKKSVAFTGLSGVGKTALAAYIANQWRGPVFWFTLRPGFNDQAVSLLFALADFLRGQGLNTAWRQAAAHKNNIDLNEIISVVRFDLNNLSPKSPLLCIDEIDLLDLTHEAHAQIFHILDELRKHTSTLFVGQQLIMDVDAHHHISGLSADAVAALLMQLGADLALQVQADALQRATRGLPVLVRLWAALYAAGDSMDDMLTRATTIASVGLLIERIWKRLDDDERGLLLRLAVMRDRTQANQWQWHITSLQSLVARGLVEQDASDTIALLPHLRAAIQQHATGAALREYHLDAAEVMEASGEYLEAVYHYVQAHLYDRAVWMWYAHRQTEIDRGRSVAALEILRGIPADKLIDAHDRTALHSSRAMLLRMIGTPDETYSELDELDTVAQGVHHAYSKFVRGELLQRQNRIDEAVRTLRDALDSLSPSRTWVAVKTHSVLGFIHEHYISDTENVRREARLARLIAETDSADIERRFDAQVARKHFETAIQISETLDGALPEKYLLHSSLGRFYHEQGLAEQAAKHVETALNYAKQLGSRYFIMAEQNALMFIYNDAGRHAEAYTFAHETIKLATEIDNKLYIASVYYTVGMVCYSLGDFHEAQKYALLSLEQSDAFYRPEALSLMALLRENQGRIEEAVSLAQEAITLTDAAQHVSKAAEMLCVLGAIQKRANNLAAARDAYARALSLYAELNIPLKVKQIQAELDALN